MKRQFIFIMTDTTRWDMLGCYGNPQMRTPRLDDMAARGLRFDRAYTTQPVCGPARAGLFTGMYPHSCGSWANAMPLGADIRHLGQWVRKAGIHTAYIGKWHLDGGDYFGKGVCPEGWDPEYWYDMKNYLDEMDEAERFRSRQAGTSDEGIASDYTFGHRVTQRALDFIGTHADQDYLLVVSYDEPHDPFLCPPPYSQMYQDYVFDSPALEDDLKDKPLYQRLWAQISAGPEDEGAKTGNRRLMRCNSYADELIGQVLDAAREQAPEATLLFTSDHGDAMDAHRLIMKGPSVYDDISRIPLIFEGPRVPRGAVYPHTVSHIDLPATVLDCLDIPLPRSFQGSSLRPQVQGDSAPTGRPAFIEFNRYEVDHDGFGGFQPMRAMVTDDYKLALHLCDSDELYELSSDPHDLHNRIDDPALAATRDRLHDQLLEWMNVTRDPFRGYQWRCRPWRKDARPQWRVDGYTRQPENEPGEPRQLDYATGLEMETATRWKAGAGHAPPPEEN